MSITKVASFGVAHGEHPLLAGELRDVKTFLTRIYRRGRRCWICTRIARPDRACSAYFTEYATKEDIAAYRSVEEVFDEDIEEVLKELEKVVELWYLTPWDGEGRIVWEWREGEGGLGVVDFAMGPGASVRGKKGLMSALSLSNRDHCVLVRCIMMVGRDKTKGEYCSTPEGVQQSRCQLTTSSLPCSKTQCNSSAFNILKYLLMLFRCLKPPHIHFNVSFTITPHFIQPLIPHSLHLS